MRGESGVSGRKDDAVDAVRTALAALRDDIDTWETTSRSTDFESIERITGAS